MQFHCRSLIPHHADIVRFNRTLEITEADEVGFILFLLAKSPHSKVYLAAYKQFVDWQSTCLMTVLVYQVSSENTFASTRSSAGSLRWSRAATFVLVACLYAAIARDLVHDWWNDEGASYGFVIPPIAIGLAWVRRQALLATPAYPDGRGFLILTLACLMLVGAASARTSS